MAILVISDVHSNLAALEAVLQAAGPTDGIWVLGDLVGYGPQPNEVWACLRDAGAVCVAGNHEWAALGRLDLRTFNTAAATAARWTAGALSARTAAELGALSPRYEALNATAVHGSPRDPIWEYVTSAHVAEENFPHFASWVCFVGHTHVPALFARDAGGTTPGVRGGAVDGEGEISLDPAWRYILNPGSVGQPRDGDNRAAFLLWDPGASTVTWRRVSYDVGRTQGLMQRAGLPAPLWQRLDRGR
jgi:diadenosine tetraphosphatase ApaH/serine/threonine PP2A family protein phosphatase